MEHVFPSLQTQHVDDQEPARHVAQRRHVAAAGDDADSALVDEVEIEWRRREADVELLGQHLRQGCGVVAGRLRF
jgi:hypothetical protein